MCSSVTVGGVSLCCRELKLKTVIMDNLVPPGQLEALLARVQFAEDAEEGDGWLLAPAAGSALFGRPASASGARRPVSEYARRAAVAGGGTRFKASDGRRRGVLRRGPLTVRRKGSEVSRLMKHTTRKLTHW